MRRQIFILLVMALSTTLNAQTYESTLSKQDGFTLASKSEFAGALKQATGAVITTHLIDDGVANPGKSTSLTTPDAFKRVSAWFSTLGLKPIFRHFYALSYQDGNVFFEMLGDGGDDSRSVVRVWFSNQKTGSPLYVRVTGKPEPTPAPTIDPAILKMFIELLTPEQRVQFFLELKKYGIEQPQQTRARRSRSGVSVGYDEYQMRSNESLLNNEESLSN